MEYTNQHRESETSFLELEQGVYSALETYSNVHRGSGQNAVVSTHLYEQAREIVLEYHGLANGKYIVIFCTPRRATYLIAQLEPTSFQYVSSHEFGLSIGVGALAVKRNSLTKGVPFQSGGGTTKLISKNWVIWAEAPDKFEAGTPAIINVIAFAKALRLIKKYGKDTFLDPAFKKLTASQILYHDELESYSGKELLNEFKKTLIGRSVLVPTTEGPRPLINFDNSASTPTFSPVWDAFRQVWRQPEQAKQEMIHEVKSICAGALGAPLMTYDVIFTTNTTEAINLVAESLSFVSDQDTEPVVLGTLLEHSSNDLPWRMIPGHSMIRLTVDAEGFVDLNELEALMDAYNQKGEHGRKRIKMVVISGASNVLGVCNNLKEISRIVHQNGAKLLVDGAQLVAHRKVDIEACGIDYFAFSAHKVYAPFGCGVLIVKKGLLNFTPDELALIQSSGEENVGGIAALGKALVLLQRIGMELIMEEEQALLRRIIEGMAQVEGLNIFGIKDTSSSRFADKVGVIVFNIKGKIPSRVAREMALLGGIGVRSGCHCAHIIIKHILKISPFLEQFQRLIQILFPKFRFLGLVRVSLGIENCDEDVDKLLQVLNKISGRPDSREGGHLDSIWNETSIDTKMNIQQQIKDFTQTRALNVYS